MNNNKYYLLDAGIGIRKIIKNLSDIGIALDHLDGIFLTHEHSDHVGGLKSIFSKLECPIYMSKIAYKYMADDIKDKISPRYFRFITNNDEFKVDDLTIKTFKTYHDSSDPLGYRFECGDKDIVYITDTGHMEETDLIKNASSYIIESNHEPNILLLSARPWPLKQRIISDEGHLSNEDSAKLFYHIFGDKTESVVLYHLSKECNTDDLALSAYRMYAKENNIDTKNIKIYVANKTEISEMIEL